MMRVPRSGFSLLELTVALVLLAVGVFALASAATVAQRSFAGAEAAERAARAAAIVIDSLLHVPAPRDGARTEQGSAVRWQVLPDSGGIRLAVRVDSRGAGRMHTFEFHAFALGPRP